ncbi:COP1-interacting protein [Quillaja saponaria]|uniref:COP1-interacting protein n=1 Tax=Quillaja saponaria TaxID=32244 RepID=A0AAD7KW10_QUISA|nr:COP1-interacting protein [Quillaja saponaria]
MRFQKGGYSIKLLPPTNFAPWFTKATLERFVRFVSTPAILERFVSNEREIVQIESPVEPNDLSKFSATVDEGIFSAVNSNARSSADSIKQKGELKGSYDVQEENSKICLQSLMESRIALLRKEQAMAYACCLVAGFEVDNIDNLVCFGDAFGASRL